MLSKIKEILKTVAAYITSPLWFPVLMVLLGTEIAFLPSEWRLRRQMKRAGRSGGLELLHAGGTVIHDRPTFSWGISRLWWTPDDVIATAPIPPQTMEQHRKSMRTRGEYRWHEFDRWISDRYLDPAHGTAVLIAAWHPQRILRRIREQFPACPIVESFSGGRGYEQHCRALEEAIKADPAGEAR